MIGMTLMTDFHFWANCPFKLKVQLHLLLFDEFIDNRLDIFCMRNLANVMQGFAATQFVLKLLKACLLILIFGLMFFH